VVPILEIGRHGREQTVRRVRNPEGGTNRAGSPGDVDLPVDAAVGERNPRRVSRFRKKSAGAVRYGPEGESNPMEAAGAPVPADRDPKDREAVKTAWRVPRTE
jgi:hypothetical protein